MKPIACFSLFVVLCTTLIGSARPALAQSAAPDDFGKVDAYVGETLRRLPIKGLAVAIVQDDQVLYMKGYGIANTQGEPVTPQTPFILGSVTKTFTALAVQQLISAGKIGELKPVQSYLPAFRLAGERGGADVSIRNLLVHTSGISMEEGDAPYLYNPKTAFPEALDQLARFRPEYRPGEHYEYSNWNYILLREVIAQASGQSYTSYVQEHILDPLGMPRTSFSDYHTLPNAATYDLNVFGFPVPYDEPYTPVGMGAWLLSASAEDMSHYLIAFLSEGKYQGKALLPERSDGWYDGYWAWHASSPQGMQIQFSGGHNSTSANFQLIPRNKLGVVVLMNTRLDETIPMAPTANDIAANIASIVMGETYRLPNFNGFYAGAALIDGLLLILIASTAWQALRLKAWAKRYAAAPRGWRWAAWAGIALDLLICAGILALPMGFQASWATLLYMRPDFSIPLLAAGVGMGGIGAIKAITGAMHGRRSVAIAEPRQA